jgi:hypothetical protein
MPHATDRQHTNYLFPGEMLIVYTAIAHDTGISGLVAVPRPKYGMDEHAAPDHFAAVGKPIGNPPR